MRRSAVLPIAILAAAALAESGTADAPPETVLPAPAVVAVGHSPTPWMRTQLRRLPGPLRPARHPRALVIARLRLTIPSTPEHVWYVTYRGRSRALCGVMLDAASGTTGLTTGGLPCSGGCGALCGRDSRCAGGVAPRNQRDRRSAAAPRPHEVVELREGAAPAADGARSRSAEALTVLVHESTHLRGIRAESVVQCYAMQQVPG